MKEIYYYETMYGKMGVAIKDDKLTNIWFNGINEVAGEIKETKLHKKVNEEIKEYFYGERKKFDLPLEYSGTDFQNKVWRAIMNIPYGETRTYKDIAEEIGSPNASRAVGMCNNKNPIPIIFACHRVVGSDGSLTGYAYGLDMKKDLLELEKENK